MCALIINEGLTPVIRHCITVHHFKYAITVITSLYFLKSDPYSRSLASLKMISVCTEFKFFYQMTRRQFSKITADGFKINKLSVCACLDVWPACLWVSPGHLETASPHWPPRLWTQVSNENMNNEWTFPD